jgi:hypothetical protein
MKLPFGLLLPIVAVVATGIAIASASDLTTALPAAVVALVAAGLLFVEVAWGASERSAAARSPEAEPASVGLRVAFRAGLSGRETVVEIVDRLERSGPNPGLPTRRVEESARILRMSPAEFRRYLAERLDELERRL